MVGGGAGAVASFWFFIFKSFDYMGEKRIEKNKYSLEHLFYLHFHIGLDMCFMCPQRTRQGNIREFPIIISVCVQTNYFFCSWELYNNNLFFSVPSAEVPTWTGKWHFLSFSVTVRKQIPQIAISQICGLTNYLDKQTFRKCGNLKIWGFQTNIV